MRRGICILRAMESGDTVFGGETICINDFVASAAPTAGASNVDAVSSGTNAGGPVVIKDSVFSRNRAGIVPNSLNNDDAPPPQNGLCPGTTRSCTVISQNFIGNNNNANVPTSGLTPAVGTGVEISGGAFDGSRRFPA